MFQIKQSDADAAHRRIPVLLVDITDGFTPETGVTAPTINVSKNGATPVSGAGTWAEIGNGQYYYQLTTGEVDTLGWVSLNIEKATVSRDYNSVVQIMAYDPFDVVRIGLTALPNAAAGAVGGLPTGNASGQVTVAATATGALTSTSFAANSLTASALATDAVQEVVNGVWDEPYASHTTAGTMGKLLDILRKANFVTEGTVAASGSPANSTVYFRTNLTGANNFYTDQTLLFVSGTLSGQSLHIDSFTTTNGVIQTSDALTATPTSGDQFVVLGEHSWSRNEISDAVLTRSLTSAGAANNIAITSIVSNVFQAVNTLAVDDRVTFVGTAPVNFALGVIYWVISGSLTSTTFTLSTAQGGLGIATPSTGAFTATKVTGRDMLSAMRYLRNKVDISGSTMTVYQEDDTSAAWNAALTTTAGVNPVTSLDPS
jgi:hypothetical protein